MKVFGLCKLWLLSLLQATVSIETNSRPRKGGSSVFDIAIGLDLGSQNVKVSYIDSRGPDPFAIMLNDLSERKTLNAVAFRDDQVLIGSHAVKSLLGHPETGYNLINKFLGRDFNDEEVQKELGYTVASYFPGGNNNTMVKINGADVAPVEYLTALIISKLRDHTEIFSDRPVTDAVITVPVYFGQSQRQAIMDAAAMTGLNILGIRSDISSAATFYGLFSPASPDAHYSVLIDSGATHTTAAVLYVNPHHQENGKNLTLIEVRQVKTDFGLCGLTLDRAVASVLEKKFHSTTGLKVSRGKNLNQLMLSAAKAKHILSANMETRVNIDSLVDDKNLSCTIKREEFENECSELKGRAIGLIEGVLEDAGLKSDDIVQIISIGGNSRVPFIQAELKNKFGSKISYTMNMDETVAKGAAWNAAILSGKSILKASRTVDIYPYGISLSYKGFTEGVLSDLKTLPIYPKQTPVGGHKGIAFTDMENLEFVINSENQGALYEGSITGAKAAYEKFADKKVISKKLKFWADLTTSGFVELDGKPVAVITYEEEQPKPPPTRNQNATSEEADVDQVGSPIEYEVVTKTETVVLNLTITGQYKTLDPVVIQDYFDRMETAKGIEKLAVIKSAARNSLESNVYRIQDFLEDPEGEVFIYFQEQEKLKLKEEIDRAKTLLDEDEEKVDTTTYEAALRDLLAPEASSKLRFEEHYKIDTAFEKLEKAIVDIKNYIASLLTEHPTEETRGPTDEDLKNLGESASEAAEWKEVSMKEFKKLTLKDDPPVKATAVESRSTEISIKKSLLLLKKHPIPPPIPAVVEPNDTIVTTQDPIDDETIDGKMEL